jgi:hypothetical protein
MPFSNDLWRTPNFKNFSARVGANHNRECKIWRRTRLRRGQKWLSCNLHMRGGRRAALGLYDGRQIVLQRRVVESQRDTL